MSVLKSLDINLSSSTKKTLRSFLLLYTFFILIITTLGIYLYYNTQKELASQEQYVALSDYANSLEEKLKELKQDTTNTLLYPWDKKFKTSLYDKNYKLLYSTKENPVIDLSNLVMTQNMIARYLKDSDEYYLGAQYIIVEMEEDKHFERHLILTIILYASAFLVFSLGVGWYLVHLFLKPMRDTLFVLDRFIKDTTHELNTPVSTILTNVELLENFEHNEKAKKIINRIDVGAKTLSNIYEDLTYLVLKHKLSSHDEVIDVKAMLEQRLEYFHSLASLKEISIHTTLEDGVQLTIDAKKLQKVIDNLLSNAVKYNKKGGSITLTLTASSLSITDSGIGIAKENQLYLFDRYARFTSATGGFGIGLHIVKSILDEYGMSIQVASEIDTFTTFTITW